jgi:hypothetical protein
MADWTVISDSALDPDAPLTSELAYAWRDNPIAIAEGAVGAPRIQFAALDTAFSTVGGLGSYAFLGRNISPGIYAAPGDVIAGSQLQYASIQSAGAAAQVQLSGTNPAGTWRCMGQMENGTGGAADVATMWLRIT